MWFFKRKPTTAPAPSADEAPAQLTPEEAASRAAREARRRDASRRIIENMRAAQSARARTEAAEAEHVRDVRDRRAKAETSFRQVQRKASEVSGVLVPPNGKTMAEVAAEALAAEQRR